MWNDRNPMHHKYFFFIIFFCWCATIRSQQIPEYVWSYRPSNSSQQFIQPCVKVNSENDIIFASRFQGNMDFDDGPGTLLLRGDFFVTKLDQNKNTKWIKVIRGTRIDWDGDMYVDRYDNIYLSGTFYGTVDFDPGPGVFNLTQDSGGTKGFMVKLDNDGNFVIAKKLGEGSRESRAMRIAVDQNQNILILGYYHGVIDFNPGGTDGKLTSNGESDIYLLSLDKNGNFQWVKSIGNSEYDYGYYMVIDADNDIYITGNYRFSTDFDSGPDEYILKGYGSSDGFVAKFSEKGTLMWAKSTGCGGYDKAEALVVDKDKNVYIGGLFSSNCNFDIENGSAFFINRGWFDLFVIKYDENGDFVWARTIGGVNADQVTALTIDDAQNIIFVGNTNTIALFETTFNDLIITSHEKSLLLAKYDPEGNKLWTASVGATGNFWCKSIATDQNGHLFIAGNFAGTADFNPLPGIQEGPSAISMDLFVIKMKHCEDEYREIEISSALPYKTASGAEISNTGTFVDTTLIQSGCRLISTIRYTKLEKPQVLGTIRIGPNPFRDEVTLYLPEPLPGLKTNLYTIDGKRVRQDISGAGIILPLNTTDLIPATYILEIELEGIKTYRKLVKI